MEQPPRRRARRAPVAAFTTALIAADVDAATRIALEHLAARGSRTAVITDLFHPAQYEIGERWYQGLLSVADEHRATAIVERLGRDLTATPSTRRVPPGTRCLVAAVTGERHVVGLRFIAMALEDDGWVVDQVPPSSSRAALLDAVTAARPRVVGLSAAHEPSLPEVTATVAALRSRDVPVVVGGPLFNRVDGLWRTVGATAHGSDARVATVLFRRLLEPDASR